MKADLQLSLILILSMCMIIIIFRYFNYNLDNKLLAVNEPKHILKLDVFNLIVFAANGWHGMVPHNRKFYWNSLENYFEPIYYDANIKIDKTTTNFNLPFSYLLEEALVLTKKKLESILQECIYKSYL